jgi:NTE family protein
MATPGDTKDPNRRLVHRNDGFNAEQIPPEVAAERERYAGSVDLVLAGGGVKGIAHVGAIQVLEDHGYDHFQRVVGTSVGALVGALVAAGVPGGDIDAHIQGFNFRDFRDLRDRAGIDRLPFLGRPLSIAGELGVYEGKRVRKWLHDVLADLGAETFGKLKARAAKGPGSGLAPGQSPLVVLATDVTRGRLVRLPDDYGDYGCEADEQDVAEAVRASMSIPVFFEPLRLGDSVLVDGGVLSNYAISTFDRDDPAQARWPTFGMTLLGSSESPELGRAAIRSVAPALRLVPGPLVPFLEDLTGTMVVGQDQHTLDRPGVRERTIQIDTDAYGVVDFDIKRGGKEELIAKGRAAAGGFMRGWDGRDGRPGSGRFPLSREHGVPAG